MKYLKSYKLFESIDRMVGDIVMMHFDESNDNVPVKIIDIKNNSGYIVSFKTQGNPFSTHQDIFITPDKILNVIKSVDDPVTDRSPLNIDNDWIRKDNIRISNDIVHNISTP